MNQPVLMGVDVAAGNDQTVVITPAQQVLLEAQQLEAQLQAVTYSDGLVALRLHPQWGWLMQMDNQSHVPVVWTPLERLGKTLLDVIAVHARDERFPQAVRERIAQIQASPTPEANDFAQLVRQRVAERQPARPSGNRQQRRSATRR